MKISCLRRGTGALRSGAPGLLSLLSLLSASQLTTKIGLAATIFVVGFALGMGRFLGGGPGRGAGSIVAGAGAGRLSKSRDRATRDGQM